MKRNLLGRTGLEVSAISLGTVELGLDYGLPGSNSRPTQAAAERLIHHALDRGINHLDTARAYGDSEAIIGAALGPRRSQVILTTKVAVNPETIIQSLETSLRLLRTDYVDIVMLHSAPQDSLTDPAVIDHLLALQSQGKFHHLGASVYGPAAARAAIGSGLFSCLQIAYNPLDRRPEALFSLPGSGFIARSVLLKGAITSRYRDLPPTYSGLQQAIARLDLLGLPLPELAYRYVLSHKGLATALAGTAHPGELDQILHYAELGPLPEDLQTQIRQEPALADLWLNPGLWPSG